MGNLSGTCDANGNCNLCSSLGAGASCSCAGGGTGTCDANGQCSLCTGVQLIWRGKQSPTEIFIRQGSNDYQGTNGTLETLVNSPGGTFIWTTSVSGIVDVSGSGDHVTLKGSSIGSSDVLLTYVDPNGNVSSAKVTVTVIYPIVLVHGFNSNPIGAWTPLSDYLQTQTGLLPGDYNCNALPSSGDVEFCAIDFCDEGVDGNHVQPSFFCPYGGSLPIWGSFSRFVDEGFALSTMISNLRRATGADQVTVVAHSMGGLASRVYLQLLGGRDVYRLITIGTPNAGTPLASLALDPVLTQAPNVLLFLAQRAMKVGSPAVKGMSDSGSSDLNELNGLYGNNLPPNTQYVSIVGQAARFDTLAAQTAWNALVAGECSSNPLGPVCRDLLRRTTNMLSFFASSDLIVPTSSQDLQNAVPVPGPFCLVPIAPAEHSPLGSVFSTPETRELTTLLEVLDLTGINPCLFP